MSFGKMPIANNFLLPKDFKKEYFFNLEVAFCPKCTMFQLMELVKREKMFHENYAFYSSTSKRMAEHFEKFAHLIQNKYLINKKNPFVVEIGSNDGIMLKHFAKKKIKHLGIEPSRNVAQVAIKDGINTIVEFFDQKLAEKIVKKHGQADVFFGANVMCHIPYFHSIVAGIKKLVKPDGIVVFEEPYLGDVIQKTSYDQIYDEHCFLFSVSSINYIFDQYDMEIFDIAPQEVHGGSMRYFIAHKDARKISSNVQKQINYECRLGLHLTETYQKFKKNCENSRDKLKKFLIKIRKTKKRVVGYAATSKSTTIFNYCQIGPNLIEFISDTTPIKQGKFSPGMHIPVKPYEEFIKNYPDYALLLGWNHAKEIMAKEKKFKSAGGRWIVFVPKVKIL